MTTADLLAEQHERNTDAQPAKALAGLVVRRIPGLWQAIQKRRSIGRLLDWDARMLQDVGLTRGDVLAAMAGKISDNPVPRQSTFAARRRSVLRGAP